MPRLTARDAVVVRSYLGPGDERVPVGRPHLLAESLGERRTALEVRGVRAGGGGGLVRVAHEISCPIGNAGHWADGVESSV